ncbi:MAG: hypothetical protein J6D28_02960 [Bacilli bacterium]|nr:hypothetical protein [Bacilli bacterium]
MFKNLKELKDRITPVINTKIKELRKNHYLVTTNDDIWEYLKNKWMKTDNLTLYDITCDILNLDNDTIEAYSIERRGQNE